jgi:hypothetical protein
MPRSGDLRLSECPDCWSPGCKYTAMRPCSDTQSRDTSIMPVEIEEIMFSQYLN